MQHQVTHGQSWILGHLETKVYLDLQADEGLWVLRVSFQCLIIST